MHISKLIAVCSYKTDDDITAKNYQSFSPTDTQFG